MQNGKSCCSGWLAEIGLILFVKIRDQSLFAIYNAGFSLVFGRIDEFTFFLAGLIYLIQK
jgi:hypothetical protein